MNQRITLLRTYPYSAIGWVQVVHLPAQVRKPYLVLFGTLLALLLMLGIAQAQSAPVSRTVTADDVNLVASELWCPLCSGVRLDACELQACAQMREEIGIKLEAGENTASIKEYFLARYGPQVLGAPPRQGSGWLVWLVPPAVLVLGGIFFVVRTRQMIRPTVAASAATATSHDLYAQKLDEELKRYE